MIDGIERGSRPDFLPRGTFYAEVGKLFLIGFILDSNPVVIATSLRMMFESLPTSLSDSLPRNKTVASGPVFILCWLAMRNLPPLNCLQAFEAAARHLSFTEAAKELNCTQAAVSQRVRGLETYLSRQLFLRKSNGLELSEAGEAYLPGVVEALDVAAAATEGLRGKNLRRTVTVSAPVSFQTIWLIPRLKEFLDLNRNIEVRLNSAIWTDPNADLADITIEVRETTEIDASTPRLPSEQLVLVCAPSLVDCFSRSSLQDTLRGLRKIFIQGRHNPWQRWAKSEGLFLDGEVPDLNLDNAVSALEATTHELGITVAYSTYCKPYLASGRLVTPPRTTHSTGLCHALILPPSRPSWHPAHRVFEWLKSEFRRQPPADMEKQSYDER